MHKIFEWLCFKNKCIVWRWRWYILHYSPHSYEKHASYKYHQRNKDKSPDATNCIRLEIDRSVCFASSRFFSFLFSVANINSWSNLLNLNEWMSSQSVSASRHLKTHFFFHDNSSLDKKNLSCRSIFYFIFLFSLSSPFETSVNYSFATNGKRIVVTRLIFPICSRRNV